MGNENFPPQQFLILFSNFLDEIKKSSFLYRNRINGSYFRDNFVSYLQFFCLDFNHKSLRLLTAGKKVSFPRCLLSFSTIKIIMEKTVVTNKAWNFEVSRMFCWFWLLGIWIKMEHWSRSDSRTSTDSNKKQLRYTTALKTFLEVALKHSCWIRKLMLLRVDEKIFNNIVNYAENMNPFRCLLFERVYFLLDWWRKENHRNF